MPGAGRLGDLSQTSACAHGCPLCPHPAVGPAIAGSPTVLVNGLPALRLGDQGVHAACCGPNTWTAVQGSASVMVNGKPAHRQDDMDQHCGGMGKLALGSLNVSIGGAAGGGGSGKAPAATEEKTHKVDVTVVDAAGKGLGNRPYSLKLPDGSEKKGRLPKDGHLVVEKVAGGACALTVGDIEEVRWSKHLAGHDEAVEMRLLAHGYEAGTKVRFEVFRRHQERDGQAIAKESAALDAAGQAAASFHYALDAAEGDAAAFVFKARIDDVAQSSDALVVERAITGARVSSRSANEGDEVELLARTRGLAPGTAATVSVYLAGRRAGADTAIATLQSSVEGGGVRVQWKTVRDAEDSGASLAYFVVEAAGARATSEMVLVRPRPAAAG